MQVKNKVIFIIIIIAINFLITCVIVSKKHHYVKAIKVLNNKIEQVQCKIDLINSNNLDYIDEVLFFKYNMHVDNEVPLEFLDEIL